MVLQVAVWAEDEDRSGAETGLDAVADPHKFFKDTGDTFEIPAGYPFVVGAYFWTEFAAYGPDRARITSPKITQTPFIMTKGIPLVYQTGMEYDFIKNPMVLGAPGDDLTAYSLEQDEATVAHFNAIGLIFSDGKSRRPLLEDVPLTQIHHSVPATATSAAVTWTSSDLTESYALEAGSYACWGARVVSATGIAARFQFDNYKDHPPVLPVSSENSPTPPINIWPQPYVFKIPGGLPVLEYMAAAAETGSHVELYLQRVA